MMNGGEWCCEREKIHDNEISIFNSAIRNLNIRLKVISVHLQGIGMVLLAPLHCIGSWPICID